MTKYLLPGILLSIFCHAANITIIQQSYMSFYRKAEFGIKSQFSNKADIKFNTFNAFGSTEKVSSIISDTYANTDMYIAIGSSVFQACKNITDKPVFFLFVDYPETLGIANNNFYGIANDINEQEKFSKLQSYLKQDSIPVHHILAFKTLRLKNSEHHIQILKNILKQKYPQISLHVMPLDPGFCRSEADFENALQNFFAKNKQKMDLFYVTNDGNVVRFMNIILKFTKKENIHVFGNYFVSNNDIQYYYEIDYTEAGRQLSKLINSFLSHTLPNKFHWEYIKQFSFYKKE